jgi:hypothetical protein
VKPVPRHLPALRQPSLLDDRPLPHHRAVLPRHLLRAALLHHL